jgi:hypothetical protein
MVVFMGMNAICTVEHARFGYKSPIKECRKKDLGWTWLRRIRCPRGLRPAMTRSWKPRHSGEGGTPLHDRPMILENAIDGRYIWLPIQWNPDGSPFLEWKDRWDWRISSP